MPGIPVVVRETSCSRSTDQMCRSDSRGHLTVEEKRVAEDSLTIYCKPVELYNIIQKRTLRNPSFLQRCLHYRIKAKHKRRIQMKISLSQTMPETPTVFPLYIFLGRLVSDVGVAEYSATYRISRLCMFRNCSGIDGDSQVQANFTLPEVNKLAVEARSGSLAILFVSFVENLNSSTAVNSSRVPMDLTSLTSTAGEYCLYGKVSLESLYMTWESSPSFSLGQRVEIMSTVNLLPCFLKSDFLNEDKCISLQVPCNSENVSTSKQVEITISAEEFGGKTKSTYRTYTRTEVPSSSLSRIIRLREGSVMFNYRYYDNKLQRTEGIVEVTADFSCPFCLVKCASFQGLKYHLPSSHDHFNFEFWLSDEFQAVNVSVKPDALKPEFVADGVDPKLQTFFFCAKPPRRRKAKTSASKNGKRVHTLVSDSDLNVEDTELLENTDRVSKAMRLARLDPDYNQSTSENNIGTSAAQFAKTRKSSVELSDTRNTGLLKKRQFFHSHRAQPMALEQVLSDQDSEDEVDDDVRDLEDRRMLDNFVDVTKDEKQIMHMWNSFVRKQRVLADGHIPWACEAFSKKHGLELVQNPELTWSWRLLMIKLWNHGLLDARVMNECNIILEQYQKQDSDPKS